MTTITSETPRARALTGFVRIEESDGRPRKPRAGSGSPPPPPPPPSTSAGNGHGTASPDAPTPAKARARARVFSRWLYGVLKDDSLRLYWRRTDYKRRAPPLDELALQMKARESDESVFGFDHECVYVRTKDSGRLLSIRIHQKKDIVRWVTALYYQSLSGSGSDGDAVGSKDEARGRRASLATASAPSSASTSPASDARAKRKSVSFQEEPQVVVLPRQSYNPDDLFYSPDDYEQFMHERKSHLSSLMQAIYAKTAAKLKVSPKKQLR